MRLYSLVMDSTKGLRRYTRMAEVFQRSIRDVQPDLETCFRTTSAPPLASEPYKPNVLGFRAKLAAWNEWVSQATEPIILADCDMLMVNPVERFPGPKPIYFTERETESSPLNTGIVFVNPGSAARAFFRAWLSVYDAMLQDFDFYMRFAPQYAGGDQAALGCVLEESSVVDVDYLPCSEWNATQSEWDAIDFHRVKFVHIKSDLRKLCLNERHRMRNDTPTPAMLRIANLWGSYESE
jgi:hypothetical protein